MLDVAVDGPADTEVAMTAIRKQTQAIASEARVRRTSA